MMTMTSTMILNDEMCKRTTKNDKDDRSVCTPPSHFHFPLPLIGEQQTRTARLKLIAVAAG